ncbi:MAG: LuxR C-terminal-related transcriptional regulator, partial [Prevotellaceae bacterium]|nr:LuxR C-terminal-related transcriptional regulator [Prevotellaceae bacterium]
MSKIKQMLRLYDTGYTNRQIAKALSIDKETVNKYVRQVKSGDIPVKSLLKMEDLELEKHFYAGNPAYTDARMEKFLELLPYFKEQLSHKHVTRYHVWEEYKQRFPDGYGRSQFFFHLKQNLVAAIKPTTVLTDTYTPGNYLFVDFAGDTLSYVDPETGEII